MTKLQMKNLARLNSANAAVKWTQWALSRPETKKIAARQNDFRGLPGCKAVSGYVWDVPTVETDNAIKAVDSYVAANPGKPVTWYGVRDFVAGKVS